MVAHYPSLNPEKALIWRIVHRDNVRWILDHGVHCASSPVKDPGYIQIGNPDLIGQRSHRTVPMSPGGTLAEYVPFYFTPFSPMLLNIVTGRNVARREKDEICVLVSSLPRVVELGLPFVCADRHAYLQKAHFFNDLADLRQLDWPRLAGLLGIICYSDPVGATITSEIARRGLTLKAVVRPDWYF